jgi:hypothetical protein
VLKSKKLSTAALCVLASMKTFGADIYVSPSGNNQSSGAKGSPVQTINRGAQLAKAGDTVYVAPGVYKENVVTNVKNTSAQKRVRFISEKKWGAQVIGSGKEAMWSNNGSYVDIMDFDISGPGRLGIMNQGSFALISGNHIHDLKVSGGCTGAGGAGIVNSNYSASDNDVIGNLVHDIGVRGACNGVQGIYSSNLRGKISNNVVYRSSSFGIHLWHAANNVIVSNNTVFANGSASMGGGIVLGTGDAPGGIVLDNSKVINNIIYDNPATSITQYCYKGEDCIGSKNIIANNLIFKNGSPISLKKGVATGTISADPLFVNYIAAGLGDYKLKANSPAIDKGLASGAPANDLDGSPRVGLPDIGAYELKSSAPAPAPALPFASFSASTLAFPNTSVGASSASQVLTISNSGTAPLIFSNIKLSGDYAFASNGTCKLNFNYASKESCTVVLNFKPAAQGARTGTLAISSNSSASLTNISLQGTGVVSSKPVAIANVRDMNFGDVKVSARSAVKVITLTNSGSAPLIISEGFKITGPYAFGGSGTCAVKVSYAPGQSCTASIVFLPTMLGQQSGSIVMKSNADAVSVNFVGNGIK